MRRHFIAALLLSLSIAPALANYDENADAKAEVKAAAARAASDGKAVLVVFGANWCGDCKALDSAFKQGNTASLLSKRFHVVKVDVGRMDKNTDMAQNYGVPLKKGIPAVAVLGKDGKLLHASQDGELADARKLGDAGIHDYFAKIVGGATR